MFTPRAQIPGGSGGGGGGTPGGLDTQVQFNDGGAFGGDSHYTHNKTTHVTTMHAIRSDETDGLLLESANGTDVGVLGAANTANVTWYGAHNFDVATQDTIAAFTGAGKTLGSLATATYPSLTELSYVKGATSAIQTQLNSKAADADVVHDTGDETIAGVKTFSSDPIIPDEAYGAGWNGSLEPPTKNAVYDKIQTMSSGGPTLGLVTAINMGFGGTFFGSY